jgi:release factor glutamine methyltransferase
VCENDWTSLGRLLELSVRELQQHGRDAPRLSAELLAAQALGLSRLDILLGRTTQVGRAECERVRALVRRRAAGEPLAYILGHKEFFGRRFTVTPDVLIPRPETERIVDLVKEAYRPEQPRVFGDICTGSGNLAISLALELPASQILASDISGTALEVARANVAAYGLERRVLLFQGDMAAAYGRERLDAVVANPPYLSRVVYEAAGWEVRGFEPRQALLGGSRGLSKVRALVDGLWAVLKPGGCFFIEIGPEQATALLSEIQNDSASWTDLQVVRDLQGRRRVLSGRRV